MLTTDRKMLLLPDILKDAGLISMKKELYDVLGVNRQHFNNVKNAEKYGREYHFTAEHIRIVCTKYSINANWITDLEDNVFRHKKAQKTVKKQPHQNTENAVKQ